MKYLLAVLTLGLMACSGEQGIKGDTGGHGSDGSVVVITPSVPSDIELVVAQENAYRNSIGTSPLVPGMVCTLYTVPNGTAAIVGAALTTVTTYGYHGVFNQPDSSVSAGLNILPPALRSLYTSWFVVKCKGYLAVTSNDYRQFDLTSDDGSLLYLDGALLINNDGNHGATLKSGTKFLRYGVHSIELDYMEGPAGNQALMLPSVTSEELFH